MLCPEIAFLKLNFESRCKDILAGDKYDAILPVIGNEGLSGFGRLYDHYILDVCQLTELFFTDNISIFAECHESTVLGE